MGPGTASWMRCWSVPTRMVSLTGRSRSTPRSVALTSTAPISSAPQGAPWNHKNLRHEPPDHALGRSRGGLSTKIHQLVDGHGLPLVILCGPGQGGDSPDRKSTRLNSSHVAISYAVFCLKKK